MYKHLSSILITLFCLSFAFSAPISNYQLVFSGETETFEIMAGTIQSSQSTFGAQILTGYKAGPASTLIEAVGGDTPAKEAVCVYYSLQARGSTLYASLDRETTVSIPPLSAGERYTVACEVMPSDFLAHPNLALLRVDIPDGSTYILLTKDNSFPKFAAPASTTPTAEPPPTPNVFQSIFNQLIFFLTGKPPAVCGNNVCDEDEDYQNCLTDCTPPLAILQIKTNEGAEALVYEEGRLLSSNSTAQGETSFNLPPSEYSITLVNALYKNYEGHVELSPGESKTLNIEMEAVGENTLFELGDTFRLQSGEGYANEIFAVIFEGVVNDQAVFSVYYPSGDLVETLRLKKEETLPLLDLYELTVNDFGLGEPPQRASTQGKDEAFDEIHLASSGSTAPVTISSSSWTNASIIQTTPSGPYIQVSTKVADEVLTDNSCYPGGGMPPCNWEVRLAQDSSNNFTNINIGNDNTLIFDDSNPLYPAAGALTATGQSGSNTITFPLTTLSPLRFEGFSPSQTLTRNTVSIGNGNIGFADALGVRHVIPLAIKTDFTRASTFSFDQGQATYWYKVNTNQDLLEIRSQWSGGGIVAFVYYTDGQVMTNNRVVFHGANRESFAYYPMVSETSGQVYFLLADERSTLSLKLALSSSGNTFVWNGNTFWYKVNKNTNLLEIRQNNSTGALVSNINYVDEQAMFTHPFILQGQIRAARFIALVSEGMGEVWLLPNSTARNTSLTLNTGTSGSQFTTNGMTFYYQSDTTNDIIEFRSGSSTGPLMARVKYFPGTVMIDKPFRLYDTLTASYLVPSTFDFVIAVSETNNAIYLLNQEFANTMSEGTSWQLLGTDTSENRGINVSYYLPDRLETGNDPSDNAFLLATVRVRELEPQPIRLDVYLDTATNKLVALPNNNLSTYTEQLYYGGGPFGLRDDTQLLYIDHAYTDVGSELKVGGGQADIYLYDYERPVELTA